MQPVEILEFAHRHPHLFHVAVADAWPSIQRLGLLSTSALLDLFEVPADERAALEEQKREGPATLTHPELGSVVLRDQAPLDAGKLAASLDDMTVGEWLRLLNARVFFWFDRTALLKLLGAKAYRDQTHEVITFDSVELLRRRADRVELSPINSGATLFKPARRGSRTFRPLGIYDIVEKRKPVELTVLGAVPDAADFALRVEEFRGPALTKLIWASS